MVEVPVEQVGQRLAHAAGGEVPVDVGVEVRRALGGEDQYAVLQRDPPQVAGEVDDLGACRLRHLDVAGLGNSDQLADHRVRVGRRARARASR